MKKIYKWTNIKFINLSLTKKKYQEIKIKLLFYKRLDVKKNIKKTNTKFIYFLALFVKLMTWIIMLLTSYTSTL